MKEPALLYSVAPCLVLLFAVRVEAADQDVGKFWHVTDFHYDPTYWTTQLSCHGNAGDNPPAFGDYWCDSPWDLVTAAIEGMASIHEDVDFIIWTGDTVPHFPEEDLSVELDMSILQNVTNALADIFLGKAVYPSFGNHDHYPRNQFRPGDNLIYNITSEIWGNWIEEPAQLDNFLKGGYYTRLTAHGLRIVVLNTNLYYTSNEATRNIEDPSDQIQWLRDVLKAARDAKEKVILIAHIPPGVHTPTGIEWYQSKFKEPVRDALVDYSDVLVAMHFGHDHHDGFKVLFNENDQPAVPLFVAPSVTPWRYKLQSGEIGPPHNPSIRLVTYDRNTGLHLDIEQYRLDLPAANDQNLAQFTRLYTFTEKYNVPDLSAHSLDQLVTRMEDSDTDGEELVQDYFWLATAGADLGGETCDASCRIRILCGFKIYDHDTFDACVEERTGSASGLLPAAAMVVLMVVTVFSLTG